MWGMTAGGFVQLTATGAETFIPASVDATELTTQAYLRAQVFQLAGNRQSLTVGGVGECRPVDAPASAGQGVRLLRRLRQRHDHARRGT